MKLRILAVVLCVLLFVPVLSAMETGFLSPALEGEEPLQTVAAPFAITLTAYNPPIVLPGSGGTFQYTIEVDNNRPGPAVFDVWTIYTLPDGSESGPVFGPERFRIPGNWSAGRDDLTEYISGNMPPGTYIYSAFVGRYPDRIAGEDAFTFEKLPDGGWYHQVPGTGYSITGVDFVDIDTGWAVSDYWEIIHSTDGGDTWFPQDHGQPYPHEFLDVDFVDAQTGWVVGHGWSLGGTILHTSDAGSSWTKQVPDDDYTLNGVSFVDAYTGWVVGGYFDIYGSNHRRVIEHTTDGGATWVSQYWEAYEKPFNAVHFVDANSGWAVGGSGGIVHTADGGGTWTVQAAGTSQDLQSVHFVDANTGWCVGAHGTVRHTTDGGDNWVPQNAGTVAQLAGVHFTGPNTGWIVGTAYDPLQATILHSTDGGASWHSRQPGPGDADFLLYDVHFVDASHGWAAGGDAFPYNGIMLHTESGGE